MFKVIVEKECGCFKKSGEKKEQTFDTKDAAREEAYSLAEEMNEMFCKKHIFAVKEEGNIFLITVTPR